MIHAAKRLTSLLLTLLLLFSLSGAKAASKATPAPQAITEEVVQDVPDLIQQLLDLAREQWIEADAKELKEVNKYTEWRGKGYKFGWCGGFITWCMLELGIDQKEHTKIKEGDVPGIVHVKEAGVGKLVTGYQKMHRSTLVPQKGFIVVYGNRDSKFAGITGLYHVGLVYDVESLGDGKYRLTTIEGNVSSKGDDSHKKAGHTIRMYVRDYDMNAEKKRDNTPLVPEEERDQEETALFSYHYTYDNKSLYVNCFLMPWIPGDESSSGDD